MVGRGFTTFTLLALFLLTGAAPGGSACVCKLEEPLWLLLHVLLPLSEKRAQK